MSKSQIEFNFSFVIWTILIFRGELFPKFTIYVFYVFINFFSCGNINYIDIIIAYYIIIFWAKFQPENFSTRYFFGWAQRSAEYTTAILAVLYSFIRSTCVVRGLWLFCKSKNRKKKKKNCLRVHIIYRDVPRNPGKVTMVPLCSIMSQIYVIIIIIIGCRTCAMMACAFCTMYVLMRYNFFSNFFNCCRVNAVTDLCADLLGRRALTKHMVVLRVSCNGTEKGYYIHLLFFRYYLNYLLLLCYTCARKPSTILLLEPSSTLVVGAIIKIS